MSTLPHLVGDPSTQSVLCGKRAAAEGRRKGRGGPAPPVGVGGTDTMRRMKRLLAITMGDPTGVGPETIARAWGHSSLHA